MLIGGRMKVDELEEGLVAPSLIERGLAGLERRW